MADQFPNSRNAGFQERYGQGLCLVKNDHAARQIMQLTAPGSFGGVQGLEKLHRRGNDHRRVPVFAGQTAAASIRRFRVALFVRQFRLAVMLQNVFRPQNLRKDLCVLFNNAGVGDHVNDPFHAVTNGVGQGKGQRRYGFPTARGNRQGEQAFFLFPALQAAPQNVAPFGAQLVFWFFQPRGYMGL